MKIIAIIVACILLLGYVLASPRPRHQSEESFHSANALEHIDSQTSREVAEFRLFTRLNPLVHDLLVDISSVENSKYSPLHDVKVIVHGWTWSSEHDTIKEMTEAFLRAGDFNVIVVDYRDIASQDYVNSVRDVPTLGLALGGLLSILNEVGTPFSQMHLVGMSLGGHVAGHAGRAVGGLIQRITGLDPAGPLWTVAGERLNENDAIYVEVIHTNAGINGFQGAMGDVDFYPNGGRFQPGCGLDNFCSHERSNELFIQSIGNRSLVGLRCNSVTLALLERCSGPDNLYLGGENTSKTGSGIFHLNTNSESPYINA